MGREGKPGSCRQTMSLVHWGIFPWTLALGGISVETHNAQPCCKEWPPCLGIGAKAGDSQDQPARRKVQGNYTWPQS